MKHNDDIDIRQAWNVVARRKWSILGLATAFGVLATLFVFAVSPTYKASSTILIESQQANVVSIQEVYGLDTQNQQYYASQFEILKSRPIIVSVINSLKLAEKSEFNPNIAGSDASSGWRSWLPGIFSSSTPALEPELIQTAVEIYRGKLSVMPVRNTQLVHVSFESEDPALAAHIANAHAEAYIENMLEARESATESASGWMSERIEGLRDKLHESESKLQAFREREKLVDAEGLKSLPAREVSELTLRLAEAKRRLAVAKIANQQVSGARNAQTDNLENIPAILNDDVAQQFQQAKATAQQKVAEYAKRYGPLHPTMIAAQADLAKASENLVKQQRSVAASFKNDYRAAASEVADLERALTVAKQEYQQVGRIESSLAALQREVDTNRELYDLFYSRMKETAETGDLQSANARIISAAVFPYRPFRPRKLLTIGLSTFAGFIMGVFAAFLLEGLNNTIRSATDVDEKLALPLLGMLPILQNKRDADSLENDFFDSNESQFNEVIRTVRTGVALSSLDAPHKVILVTSSTGSEGKSTVALNVALAFAKTERVLLIDCDLRRPSVGKKLGLPRNRPGLSELVGQTALPAECITYVEQGGFHVLPSGLVAADPQAILSSKRMTNLLGTLHKFYDRIILDSPPIMQVSDAVLLSVHASSVIFVVKSDATPVHQVKSAIHQLQRVNAPLTGIVVNQLNTNLADKYGEYDYQSFEDPQQPASAKEPKQPVESKKAAV